jgi:outer membrane receptor protein involved in Fe transport
MKISSSHYLAGSLLLLTFALPVIAAENTPKQLSAEEKTKAALKEVEVIQVISKRNQANSEMTEQTEQLMGVAGIGNDPLSAVYSLPGIVYAGGDTGSPAVRGSSPEDNAFYIDDIPAGYIFHLFGDSIFNENLIQDFSLHPAAFGSEYGNATGGVFDVKLRDPRQQDIETTIDLSMLKSGFMIEGETFDDQAFYVSYRRSQIHLFLPESDEEDEDGYTIFKAPVSEDYQGKYQWLIGDAHKLTFSASGATDTAGVNISERSEEGRIDPDIIGDFKITTKFDSQSLSWQYYGDEQKIMQLVAGHTVNSTNETFGKGQFVKVEEEIYNLRFSSQITWLEGHKLGFGLDYTKSDVDYSFDIIPYYCTETDADCDSNKGERTQDNANLTDEDIAIYVHDIWQMSENWQLTYGLRAESNDYTSQNFIHPRLALDWFATDDLTIKAKAGTYSRFPDVDTALNKLGNPKIKSPQSTHYSLGVDYELSDIWFTSIDVYHKELTELPRSIDEHSAEADIDLHYTNDTSGDAQGVEWLVRHERNNGWFGWASISWSQSQRTDDLTNITADYYLDTPLVGNIVTNYELNERWDFGLRFTLRSGAKYTPIVGLRENPDYEDHFLPKYGELNAKTLPVYHRLDLEANYKTTYWGYDAKWTWAIINAMGQQNVSGYYYDPSENDSLTEYNISGEEDIGVFPYIGLKMTF